MDSIVGVDLVLPKLQSLTFLGLKKYESLPCLSCVHCSNMIKGSSFTKTHKKRHQRVQGMSELFCSLCSKMPLWFVLYQGEDTEDEI